MVVVNKSWSYIWGQCNKILKMYVAIQQNIRESDYLVESSPLENFQQQQIQ